MFSKTKLEELFEYYKEYFSLDFKFGPDTVNHLGNSRWVGEGYKWRAIKHFQDTWDENAEDFAGMFKNAIAKSGNLLNKGQYGKYSEGIINIIHKNQDSARELFFDLYDETKDTFSRLKTFKNNANDILASCDNYKPSQTLYWHVPSALLALRYPEKYFIYTYHHYKILAFYLRCTFYPKSIGTSKTYETFNNFYTSIQQTIKLDKDIYKILEENLSSDMYSDPELTLVTSDLAYFVLKYLPRIQMISKNR